MNFTEEQLQQIKKLENVPNLINIDTSIKLENDQYILIERLTIERQRKKYISKDKYDILLCKNCGIIRKYSANKWIKEKHKCSNCRKQKIINEMLNLEHPVFKVLAFDHIKNRQYYFKVECKHCHTIYIKEKKIILTSNYEKCKYCQYKLESQESRNNRSVKNFYTSYQRNAKNRNLDWNLTVEEFKNIITKPCYYCGDPPIDKPEISHYSNLEITLKAHGVDRIDSSKGYNVNNCVSCCAICNRMKLDYNLKTFYTQIHKIHNHLNLDNYFNSQNF